MGEWTLPAAQVTARVTLWATNAPPDYWVIDCTTPNDRSTDLYYPNVEQIPQTVTNIAYKTEKIVFRRIASSGVTWRQGASTDDDYASARPLTGNPKTFQPNGWDAATSFNPSGSRIRTLNSALSSVKNRFAITLDLPTQAEFEYACRAGTTNLWVSGEGDFGDYAWYSGNSSTGPQDFHEVGLKLPNAWGIYDIQGNVWELGLDWSYRGSGRTSDPVWDYMGPAKTDNYRIQYGGCVKTSKNDCRASFSGRIAPAQATGMHASDANYTLGIRLVVIMP